MINGGILIRPLEPLFFGPPRSGNAGETHHRRSEFPPSIQTWQGLIRSHLLMASQPPINLNDFSNAAKQEKARRVGEPDQLPSGWQLSGPYPAHQEDGYLLPWLPVPRYLLGAYSRNGQRHCRYAHLIADRQRGRNDNDTAQSLLGRPEEDAGDSMAGWCSARMLEKILKGEDENQLVTDDLLPMPPFVKWETHTGLALEKAGQQRSAVARHGLLYTLETLRFEKESGFYGSFTGHPPSGIGTSLPLGQATWGHRSRVVAIEATPPLHPQWLAMCCGQHLPDHVGENDVFWLVTLSPVQWFDPRYPQPHIADADVEFKTLGVLTGKPLVHGGYNMAKGTFRSNRRFIPPGSAWLFRLKGGSATARAKALKALNNSFSLGEREASRFGYGHTLVGVAPEGTFPTDMRGVYL